MIRYLMAEKQLDMVAIAVVGIPEHTDDQDEQEALSLLGVLPTSEVSLFSKGDGEALWLIGLVPQDDLLGIS